jgi:hypothetical protein
LFYLSSVIFFADFAHTCLLFRGQFHFSLFDITDSLEKKLEKFTSYSLKSMLCIHSDISNKPDSIVNDLSTSTSHASNSELDFVDIKPVIVDAACSYLSSL